MQQVEPLSSSRKLSSSGTRRQFSGTAIAPRSAIAAYDSNISGPFISSSATRSPGPTPRSASIPAVRFARSSSCAQVSRSPVSTWTKPS